MLGLICILRRIPVLSVTVRIDVIGLLIGVVRLIAVLTVL